MVSNGGRCPGRRWACTRDACLARPYISGDAAFVCGHGLIVPLRERTVRQPRASWIGWGNRSSCASFVPILSRRGMISLPVRLGSLIVNRRRLISPPLGEMSLPGLFSARPERVAAASRVPSLSSRRWSCRADISPRGGERRIASLLPDSVACSSLGCAASDR